MMMKFNRDATYVLKCKLCQTKDCLYFPSSESFSQSSEAFESFFAWVGFLVFNSASYSDSSFSCTASTKNDILRKLIKHILDKHQSFKEL